MVPLLYPIGVQSFPEIRERGYVYVDKTEYIHKLVSTGKFYFLSRPRRFGKSLLLSTIEEFFKGHKELFEGLSIINYDYDWKAYPVFHFDFTGRNYNDPGSLEAHLNSMLEKWEDIYGCEKRDRAPEERFEYVVTKARELSGRKVVVLIDEYDKPLLETVDNEGQQQLFRNILRGVYGNLKKLDAYIQFAILTGVTKFGHLSIFSDLNNLQDISMDEEYDGICGITNEELRRYFDKGVKYLAERRDMNEEEAYEQLRINYDGYHFSPEGKQDIYNPFSLLNALQRKSFGDYWFQTGTPTFLIKIIKTRGLALQSLGNLEVRQSEIENVSIDMRSSLYPVLYQSGYLTIKGYRPELRTLLLGFPNREVEEGFFTQLMKIYASSADVDSGFSIIKFYDDVIEGRAQDFMVRLQSLFADFNRDGFNHINLEQHYQDITYIVFKLLGFLTHIEYKTSSGRIDAVVKTHEYIYVFEFKIDRSPEEALRQIDTNGYLLPFKADGRKIIKIGANFSGKLRTLDSWLIEEDKCS